MNIGDKVRIRTGKPGKPPHGRVVVVTETAAIVKFRDTERAYPLADLTVIPPKDEGIVA